MSICFDKNSITCSTFGVEIKATKAMHDNSTPPSIIFFIDRDILKSNCGVGAEKEKILSNSVLPMVLEACQSALSRWTGTFSISQDNYIAVGHMDFRSRVGAPENIMVPLPYPEVMELIEGGARQLCRIFRDTDRVQAQIIINNLEQIFKALNKHRGS